MQSGVHFTASQYRYRLVWALLAADLSQLIGLWGAVPLWASAQEAQQQGCPRGCWTERAQGSRRLQTSTGSARLLHESDLACSFLKSDAEFVCILIIIRWYHSKAVLSLSICMCSNNPRVGYRCWARALSAQCFWLRMGQSRHSRASLLAKQSLSRRRVLTITPLLRKQFTPTVTECISSVMLSQPSSLRGGPLHGRATPFVRRGMCKCS